MPDLVHSSQLSVHSRKESVNREPRTVNRKPKGFTLIELLVVIAIVGILVVVAVAAFTTAQKKGRDAKRKADFKALDTALQLYANDHNGQFPDCTACDSSDENFLSELVPTYIKEIPKDPSQAGILDTMIALIISKFNLPGTQEPKARAPAVAQASSVTISTDLDGHMNNTTTCNETDVTGLFVEGSGLWRTFIRFSLSAIPAGATITDVKFRYSVTVAQAANLSSLQAYGGTGMDDPAADACNTTRRDKTADDASPYLSNVALTPSVGIQPDITIPAADVQAAFVAVGRFSLGINELTTNQTNARIESLEHAGTDEPKLIITYTTGGPTAPTVTTSAATNITSSSVTLNGSGNPNGASATGWFRYSATNPGTCNDTFGTRVPFSGGSSLGSGTSPQAYSQNRTGLASSTTFYFCAIASNASGTGFGSVLSFTTSAAPVPTPTPTPVPTPTPAASPSPAPSGQNLYLYDPATDLKSYVMWGKLENENDPLVNTNTTATCQLATPAGTNYNFCKQNP